MIKRIAIYGGILILMLIIALNVYSQNCDKDSGAEICALKQTVSADSANAITRWRISTRSIGVLPPTFWQSLQRRFKVNADFDIIDPFQDGFTYTDSGLFCFLLQALHFPSGTKLKFSIIMLL